MSCALDNVPTDQPSAPKVDTNQLTKKKLAHAQPACLAESISNWYVPAQSSSGPISSLKTSLERRLNCACACERACVCVSLRKRVGEQRATETESGSMASERERERKAVTTNTCKPSSLLLFLLLAAGEVGGRRRSMHARSCST